MIEQVFDVLIPPECIFCRSVGSTFCLRCLRSCSVITYPVCVVCKRPAIDGLTHPWCLRENVPSHLFSCLIHGGKVAECFKRSKGGFKEFSSLKEMAKYGVIYSWKTGLYYSYDYVMIPIPLDKKTRKARGFNQVKFICDEMKKSYGLRYENSILIRDDIGFKVERDLKGMKVLLVDDYLVSGRTLLDACRVLYAAGVVDVKCFTLSMVL